MVSFTRVFGVVGVVAALTAVSTAQTSGTTTPPATSYPRAQAEIRSALINATFTFDGKQNGATFEGKVEGAAREPSPYSYHVHEKAVPESGNCSETGGHLDPFLRKGAHCTAATFPECEVGDLSGKYGKITVTDTETMPLSLMSVLDPTLNMTGDNGIIGRSIVVHNATGARIACANIHALDAKTDNKSGSNNSNNRASNANNVGSADSAAVNLAVNAKVGLAVVLVALASLL